MTLLTQRTQVAAKVEAVEGTAETITAADLFQVLNPTIAANLNNIRRPILRGTYSKLVSLPGIQDQEISFDVEFAGPGDGAVTTSAPLGKLLRAGGFREVPLYAVELASFLGAFVANGDVMVSDDTAASIRVIGTKDKPSFDAGNQHSDILFYELLTPAQNIAATDTLLACANPGLSVGVSHLGTTPALGLSSQTGTRCGTAWVPSSVTTKIVTVSSVTGTFQVGEIIRQVVLTSPTRYAWGRITALNISAGAGTIEYTPFDGGLSISETTGAAGQVTGLTSSAVADADADAVSAQTPTLTVEFYIDGIKFTGTGCRALIRGTLQTGQFPLLNVTLRGAYTAVADSANLTAPTTLQGPVATVLGVETRLKDGDSNVRPCWQQLGFDIGTNLVQRTCADNAAGLEGYAITDRVPTLTMDPETLQEIVFDLYAKGKGGETFLVSTRFGTYENAGSGVDAWLFTADTCQVESAAPGDRNGIRTTQATIQLNDLPTRQDGELAFLNYSGAVVDAL